MEMRMRECLASNRYCPGDTKEVRDCSNDEECEGVWNKWRSWSRCSVTCGAGTRTRTRTCATKSAKCEGNSTETEKCEALNPCEGTWSPWEPWTKCTKTCGGGEQSRKRKCVTELKCVGNTVEDRACNTDICPAVDCGWCQWSPPTITKTETCQEKRVRRREGGCPAKQHSGRDCTGNTVDEQLGNLPLSFQGSRDFHSNNPEGNRFDIQCIGGCILITKVRV